MLDIAFIRENAELVKQAVKNKGERADVDALLALDAERRKAVAEFEELRREQNRVSKEIGARRKNKEDARELLEKMKSLANALGAQRPRARYARRSDGRG